MYFSINELHFLRVWLFRSKAISPKLTRRSSDNRFCFIYFICSSVPIAFGSSAHWHTVASFRIWRHPGSQKQRPTTSWMGPIWVSSKMCTVHPWQSRLGAVHNPRGLSDLLLLKGLLSMQKFQNFYGPWPLTRLLTLLSTDDQTTWFMDGPLLRPDVRHHTGQSRIL